MKSIACFPTHFFVVLDHRKNDSDFVRSLHYNLFRGNYDHETTNMFFWFLLKVSRNSSYYISSHFFFRLSIVFFTPRHFDDYSLKGSMMKVLSGVSDPK